MSKVSIIGGKGANLDMLQSELEPGIWSNSENFHHRNGFDEKYDGPTGAVTASVAPYWVSTQPAASGEVQIVYAGLTKAYSYLPSGPTTTEITRYTNGVKIVSITFVGTTATVTTESAHGLSTGNNATIYGALPTDYNATGNITVTAATTFTYTMATTPATNATYVGAYSYNVTSNFTGTAYDRITGGSLGGIQIVNHPLDGLYYWAGDSSIRLRRVPLSYVADVGRTFKNYIIQLAPTVGGVKYPHDAIWSNAAEPGAIPTSFDASTLNDAGRSPALASKGKMVDGLTLGDMFVVYKQDCRWALQYVGGNDVFRISRIDGGDGLFARECVVDTPKGHVFLTQDLDVKIHQGGAATSIAEGRFKNYLTRTISATVGVRKLAFLTTYPAKSEVWICFPSASSTACDRAITWNWESDAVGTIDLAARPFTNAATGIYKYGAAYDTFNSLLAASTISTTHVVAVYNGYNTGTDGGNAVTGTLERTGMDFGDRDVVKYITRSRWNIDSTAAGKTASIYHGSSKTADGATTYTSAVTYTAGTTDYADARATSGRFGSVKLTTSAQPFLVRSVDLDVTGGGKR